MTEKVVDTGIIESIRIYARDGITIHTMLRDTFLEQNNTLGVMKHQGSIDTCRDKKRILSGRKVATLAEIQADIKKTQEGDQNYLR